MEQRAWETNHGRLGAFYLLLVTTFFLLGGIPAVLMRLELIDSGPSLLGSSDYGHLFTMHGIIMIFLVLIPAIPGVLGNTLLPQMIGSRGLAFPRLGWLGGGLLLGGGILVVSSLLGGGVDVGWSFSLVSSGGTNLATTALGVLMSAAAMVIMAVNFIATVHRMRKLELHWFKLPPLVWSLYLTAWMLVIAAPILVVCMFLVIFDQGLGASLLAAGGTGDPVFFKRLFWFFGRAALYIMILPAVGVVSQLIYSGRKERLWGYTGLVYSMVAVGVFGFLTGGSHLVLSGQSQVATLVSSFLGLLSALPFAYILLSWIVNILDIGRSIGLPHYYALGFIGLVFIGGLTGLLLVSVGGSIHLHETYFVLAHFHYLLAGAVLMAYLGGVHHWWASVSGRSFTGGLGKLTALLIFLGINLTFFPQFLLGIGGMPRHYHTYPQEFELFQIVSSAGLPVLLLGYILPMVYLFWSLIGSRSQALTTRT